ncbi:hypothetical protein MH139_17825, partial [Bacillus altitudinis]|uniref:hypothetical protein n=1 Tax=Bacillus altitudinis TaxID=293387 RepID=UPI002280EBC3
RKKCWKDRSTRTSGTKIDELNNNRLLSKIDLAPEYGTMKARTYPKTDSCRRVYFRQRKPMNH